MQAALSATPAALTIELKPEAIMRGRPPEPLNRDAADLLAAPIGDDLRRILGEEVADAGLVMPAALYDLTELLRPGLPMVEAMLDIYRGGLRGGPFQPQLLTIGSSGGRFPDAAIAPLRRPGSGPLLTVPFAFVAPGPKLDELSRKIESTLLEKGSASLATDRAVRQLFGVEPVHLSYATFNDLAALMRVQFEHAGFLPLWQLIESALYHPDRIDRIELDAHQFFATGGGVWTTWITFDEWSRQYSAGPEEAIAGYSDWLQIQRQYMAGLQSHAIELHVTPHLPGLSANDSEVALAVAQANCLDAEAQWLREPIENRMNSSDTAAVVTVTEHASERLGPFAYTVLVQSADGQLLGLFNDYPLEPQAMQAIIDSWQAEAKARGAVFHLERPGRVICHGSPACLQPWLDYAGSA